MCFFVCGSFQFRGLMAMRLISLCSVVLLSLMLACASRSSIVAPPSSVVAQRTDVSSIVPGDLSFAKEFVQFLSDSGWQVQAVRPSKFNGFFRETNRAAWIETDKGTLEVVFFDNDTTVEQMQISEQRSRASDYHQYVVRTAKTMQRIEGGATYFIKYRKLLIMTSDRDLNDVLNRLLANPAQART
jgi:hypothetical protein